MSRKIFFSFLILLLAGNILIAEDGYKLWLRYDRIKNGPALKQYGSLLKQIITENDATASIVATELLAGIEGITGRKPLTQHQISEGSIVAVTLSHFAECKPYFQIRFPRRRRLPDFVTKNSGQELYRHYCEQSNRRTLWLVSFFALDTKWSIDYQSGN
jgi:hypothetical protein